MLIKFPAQRGYRTCAFLAPKAHKTTPLAISKIRYLKVKTKLKQLKIHYLFYNFSITPPNTLQMCNIAPYKQEYNYLNLLSTNPHK